MKHFPWDIVLALLAGIGLGLVYAWMISPLRVTDADPSILRADFKDQYRSAIAAAYTASGNLPRAQARLKLLQDTNPIDVLNAQAQRMLAQGQAAQAADQVAALARALDADQGAAIPVSNPATETPVILAITPTLNLFPPSAEVTFVLTETPGAQLIEETQPAASTPRPTRTSIPTATQGIPFKLTGQDQVCDPNLTEGLLQIVVLSSSRKQLPGMEVDVTWEGGEEQFFTGLKPELGNGYADFTMAPGVSYTVQLAAGSDIATGLVAPACQSESGEAFNGGFKLTYQRP